MRRIPSASAGAVLTVLLLAGCGGTSDVEPVEVPLPSSAEVVVSTEELPRLESKVRGNVVVLDDCLGLDVSRDQSAAGAYILVFSPGTERTESGARLPNGDVIALGATVSVAGGEPPSNGIGGYALPESCGERTAFLVSDLLAE